MIVCTGLLAGCLLWIDADRVVRELEGAVGHFHSTTRHFQHKTFPSVNRNVRDGLCLLYSGMIDHEKHRPALAVMASFSKEVVQE